MLEFKNLLALKNKVNDVLESEAAKKAGKMADELAKGAVDTTKKVVKRGLQDKELLKKINEIHRECDRLANNHNTRMQVLEGNLEQELTIYRGILKQIDDDLLPICQCFFSFTTTSIQMTNKNTGKIELSNCGMTYMENAYADGTIDKGMLAKGLAAGATTAAGLVGTTIALGTASTGTAISALSGGALYTATLAAMGGGAVSAGGFGMLGGLVVLGSSVFVPLITVTGYLADKKIHAEYEKALQRKQNVDNDLHIADKIYNELSKKLGQLRSINGDFQSFTDSFRDWLNMSAEVISMGKESEYKNVLQNAMVAVNSFKTISFLKDDGLNPHLEEDMLNARLAFDKASSSYHDFYCSLSKEHRQMMDNGRKQKVTIDKLKKKYRTAQERIQKVNMDNKILSQQHRLDQQKINHLLGIVDDQKKQMDVMRSFLLKSGADLDDSNVWEQFDEIMSPLTKNILKENDAVIADMRREYRNHFINFDEDVINSLATSDYLYGMLKEQRDIDFSPILLPAFKAVEAVMREVLNNHGIKRPDKGWMLGAMCHAVEENPTLWREGFKEHLEDIRQVRNKTAHPGGIEIFQVERIRIILLKDTEDKSSLLSYLNDIIYDE